MTEFFLELLSEDIPPKLQVHARENIKISLEKHLTDKSIKFNSSKSFSTSKRLVFFFDGLPEKLEQKAKVLKGPKIDAPKTALEGFIKSNNLNESDIFEKEIEKGKFYFAKTKSKTINVAEEFEYIIPIVLKNYSWKKAMKWSTHDLSWARPLKSILALFNNKVVNFSFFHLKSNNVTFHCF